MAKRVSGPPPDISGYSFVRVLGSGGFSDVFLYQQQLPHRLVAIKVLVTDGVSLEGRNEFVAEANLMARLSTHPYIVTIYAAGVATDERPYIVMEYVPGPTLARQYEEQRFSVSEALRLGIRLSSAVESAHAAGILHRDIKPANVLCTAYGWPVLADFGIAATGKETGVRSTGAGGMSIPWSPAEAFDTAAILDERSDVYSLVATVYTVIAGRPPFESRAGANSSVDVIARIERGACEPIDRGDVPDSLTAVLARGLSRSPDDRYPSASEFARALQRIELELGLTPTPLELPGALARGPVARDAAEEEVPETRARVRSLTTELDARAAHAGAAQDAPAPGRGMGEDAHPAEKPIERGRHLAPRRRMARGTVIGGLGVIALAALASATVWGASAELSPDDLEPRVSTADVELVPNASGGAVRPGPDGRTVEFSWQNPAAEEGDTYLVYREIDGRVRDGPEIVDQTSLSVQLDHPEDRACLHVQINRNGKLSPEVLIMCR